MERNVYNNMRVIERDHWWFRGRRAILQDQLSRLALSEGSRILEVGSGTGGNLKMLARFGHVTGMEPDGESRAFAETQTGIDVLSGLLPHALPAFGWSFDLIAALDVIEHLEEDQASVTALAGLLKPGGWMLTTVPAHPWLWSSHDVVHHHKRRYRKADYLALFANAGLEVVKVSYFNSALFPLIALLRLAKFGRESGRGDDALPPGPANALLARLFAAERLPLRMIGLPFGVSLLVVARRPL